MIPKPTKSIHPLRIIKDEEFLDLEVFSITEIHPESIAFGDIKGLGIVYCSENHFEDNEIGWAVGIYLKNDDIFVFPLSKSKEDAIDLRNKIKDFILT